MLYFSRWKTILIWLSVVLAVIFAVPNALSKKTVESLPAWVPHSQMTLGLDLQGGSYILLEVDRGDIVKDRINATVDDVRRILRSKGIGYTGLGPQGAGRAGAHPQRRRRRQGEGRAERSHQAGQCRRLRQRQRHGGGAEPAAAGHDPPRPDRRRHRIPRPHRRHPVDRGGAAAASTSSARRSRSSSGRGRTASSFRCPASAIRSG